MTKNIKFVIFYIMHLEEDEAFISATGAVPREKRTSSRYTWNNAEREKDPHVIFQWTHQGIGHFVFEGKTHEVRAGEAFIAIVPESSSYFYPPRSKIPWEFGWINFYGPLSTKLWSILRKKFGPVIPVDFDSPAGFELMELINRTRHRKWKNRYENSIHSYQFYLTLWNQLAIPRRSYQQNIEEVVMYLRTHYREPLKIKEVAAYAGMSREHFSRIFVKRFKKTPATFIREERLQAAARYLVSTRLPIMEIALRSGFYSHAQFSNLFRRRFRKTPLHYRQANPR